VLLCLLLAILLAACSDPNATEPPHPTVIVITASGPYIALFDEPQDWLVGESDASWGRLVDGEYVLSIKKPQQLAWTNQTRVFGDGIYEVDARLETGPEASGFGMLLIGSNDLSSFLYVLITGDGRYDVGYCDTTCANETSLIGGYKLAPSIVVDNQMNHLKVELNAGTLSLTINGALVSQIQNLSYGRGVIGLIGESSQFGGFEAAFDNFSVVETQPELPTLIATVTPVEAVNSATPDPLSTVPALLEPTLGATP
jgi:hypothetical protein